MGETITAPLEEESVSHEDGTQFLILGLSYLFMRTYLDSSSAKEGGTGIHEP